MKFKAGQLVVLSLALVGHIAAQEVSQSQQSRTEQIKELKLELQRLAARLDALEAEDRKASAADASHFEAPAAAVAPAADIPTQPASSEPALAGLKGTTLSFGFDGYYGYNFNHPIGRVNLLRVYDVSSNSFSINQANVVVEHLPTETERFGGRIDLQWGQATETLQGSAANEQRPQVYRNLFQAYGSYLAPVGTGMQLDFGKFASSLGNEGNYTKDQIAYSRALSFNFLPYYHMGLRASYAFTPKVSLQYWLVNGSQQTEDFNGFKSQAFIWTFKPARSLSWNVNYYFGQDQRDVLPTTAASASPTQPGLPVTNIAPAPNGRQHIFDTYATWYATDRLTFVGEADYVINRVLKQSSPSKSAIGALYAKYALPKNWNVGGRFEYFDDRSGMFSGKSQALKELTLVVDRTFAPGFLARAEYRRDFSNQAFFFTDQTGVLRHGQSTATLGLVFWWGTKQGTW